MIPLGAFLFHDTMDLFHKRAGGIDTFQTVCFHDVIDLFCHTVSTYDHGGNVLPGFQMFQFLFILQNPYTLFRQFSDHFLVVYNGTIGIYSLPVF